MADMIVRLASPTDMPGIRDLRIAVFVREQGVPEALEMDELDHDAIHAVAIVDGKVVGTGRLILDPSGEARIGRMAVEASLRRRNIGSLVFELLESEARRRGASAVSLHAQAYARPFYERQGYVASGLPFEEAGIEHVTMRKALNG